MRKHKQITAALCIVSLLGCGAEKSVQRDVYQSKDDCLKDWQYQELCEEDQHSSSGGSGGSSSGGRRYYGPAYYEDDREVQLKTGERVKPSTNSSSGAPVSVKGDGVTAFSRPVKRGGFSSSSNGFRFGG